MLNYDDKRNFYRMLLNSEVVVTVLDDESSTELFATCRDLSATGMAVEMTHPLEVGVQIRMRIDASSASIQAFEATGKVVRVVEEASDSYLIGVTINDVE